MHERKIKDAVLEMLRMGVDIETVEYFLRNQLSELLTMKDYMIALNDKDFRP